MLSIQWQMESEVKFALPTDAAMRLSSERMVSYKWYVYIYKYFITQAYIYI